jgi:dihydrofolate reductase
MARITLDITMSLDGFVAGPDASLDDPLGKGGEQLHEWMLRLAAWRSAHGLEGGETGPDAELVNAHIASYGAVVMGRRMFSGGSGPWEQDPVAGGWWGDEPPFHTPVFVMTHHERAPLTLSDTTFHFVNADPETVLAQAREAAQGKDVRLGGGVTTVREFLDADLVDTLHIAVAPVEAGSGLRLWDSPDDLLDRFHLEVVPSPSGVTHHLFWRR